MCIHYNYRNSDKGNNKNRLYFYSNKIVTLQLGTSTSMKDELLYIYGIGFLIIFMQKLKPKILDQKTNKGI